MKFKFKERFTYKLSPFELEKYAIVVVVEKKIMKTKMIKYSFGKDTNTFVEKIP